MELDPANAPAHNNLGNALRDIGRLDEADIVDFLQNGRSKGPSSYCREIRLDTIPPPD